MDHQWTFCRLVRYPLSDRGQFPFSDILTKRNRRTDFPSLSFYLLLKQKGLTVLLVPRTEEVSTKIIKTAYSSSAGTAHVFFDGVKVPIENILGPENGGLVVILANFNHERWMMTACTIKMMRAAVEETFQWAHQRIVFGKPLLEQPVVRSK